MAAQRPEATPSGQPAPDAGARAAAPRDARRLAAAAGVPLAASRDAAV
ncbi:MAG TPA: hypothetical protein VHM67_14810 [Gemmatimonadaceae bacterium]|nr:hypothetical protein [Gemmatimonadaceae bacterium]